MKIIDHLPFADRPHLSSVRGEPVDVYRTRSSSGSASATYPSDVAAVLRYNVKDVELIRHVYDTTAACGETDVIALHHAINDRGVGFDVSFGTELHALAAEAAKRSADEIARITNGALHRGNLRSTQQVSTWLANHGVKLPNLRQDTIDRFLDRPEEFYGKNNDMAALVDPDVSTVLRLRQAVQRITGAKMGRALVTVDDDKRIRGLHQYHAAHTGRFSSTGMQVHNLPRGLDKLDFERLIALHGRGQLTYEALEQTAAELSGTSVDDVIASLVRLTLVPGPGQVLAIADYNAIELRGTAWVAREQSLLDQFVARQDVYCQMASRIFGRTVTPDQKSERKIAKETCLGCGYSMGAETFARYCTDKRIDLAAAGTSAEACVETFRDTYSAIAGHRYGTSNGRVLRAGGIWSEFEAAARRALEERTSISAGRCTFTSMGKDLVVTLPSGRDLYYRHCRIESRVPRFAARSGTHMKARPTLVYPGPRVETELFGGKITENLVQAICRDLLCCTLIRCEQEGLPVVLHVHDEVVAQVIAAMAGEALHRLVAIMVRPPRWAVDFPILVEGFDSPRYTKSPFKDWPSYKLASADLAPRLVAV
jgi:DNA polymerase